MSDYVSHMEYEIRPSFDMYGWGLVRAVSEQDHEYALAFVEALDAEFGDSVFTDALFELATRLKEESDA